MIDSRGQRIPYSAGCIGVAVKAHEMALEYAGIRETFGAPLASRQAIQWMLVDNEIDIKQATMGHARGGGQGRSRRAVSQGSCDVQTRRDRKRRAGLSIVACRSTVAMGSPRTFRSSVGIGKVRIRRIGEGPSEVQRHIIAREILGSSLL
ncbi:MAG: acyl-CoA dehydrogenase family protein [Gammaproteobacteria bacterium]|nr:acyl-CoA dehydrogenase family protein [Gammaproteobacteria bacterium]